MKASEKKLDAVVSLWFDGSSKNQIPSTAIFYFGSYLPIVAFERFTKWKWETAAQIMEILAIFCRLIFPIACLMLAFIIVSPFWELAKNSHIIIRAIWGLAMIALALLLFMVLLQPLSFLPSLGFDDN